MSRSEQDARRPARAVTRAGSSVPAPRTPGADHRRATRLVWLGVVHHMLRSRRFYERVVVAVIALRALSQLGQENRASTMARLGAWNKREIERLERKAKREIQRLERKAKQPARAVMGTRQMAHSRPSKDRPR